VDHRLLVAAQHIPQRGFRPGLLGLDFGLQEGLSDPCHVSVAEDAEATSEELAALTVALDVLVAEEANCGLCDGEPHCRLGV